MATVVVGVDGSDGSRRALEWALEEARRREATLRIVHAWSMPYVPAAVGGPLPEPPLRDAVERGARTVLEESVAAFPADGVPLEPLLVEATPAGALLAAAAGADLLVVGSRGRGGFTGLLLGSVGRQVAQHADVPVVVVPPERKR